MPTATTLAVVAGVITKSGEQILRQRLGPEPTIESVAFGEGIAMRPVQVSLHPAGYILGSAQVSGARG